MNTEDPGGARLREVVAASERLPPASSGDR